MGGIYGRPGGPATRARPPSSVAGAGPALGGDAEVVAALLGRVVGAPVAGAGGGLEAGDVLGAVDVGLLHGDHDPALCPASRDDVDAVVGVPGVEVGRGHQLGRAVDVEPDEVAQEVDEQDPHVGVLGDVAGRGHDAVAPVLGPGDGAL